MSTATTYPTRIPAEIDPLDSNAIVVISAYVGLLVTTIGLATGLAALLATLTTGLGGFVLVAAGWLAVVSASPDIADRGSRRLAELEVRRPIPQPIPSAAAGGQ